MYETNYVEMESTMVSTNAMMATILTEMDAQQSAQSKSPLLPSGFAPVGMSKPLTSAMSGEVTVSDTKTLITGTQDDIFSDSRK